MQERHLYEYAVIRVVPKVEREEFINVGIILFCKRAKYLKIVYRVNEEKIKLFSDELDLGLVYAYLTAFEKICAGSKVGGVIGQCEIPERFRWITAVKSSCIQTSRPHSGYSLNLDDTVNALFTELVL